jgi:plastocyanin
MLVFGLLASALLVAACGGGDDSSSSGGSSGSSGGETLQLAAPKDGSLKFDKSSLDAKSGTVTIDFDNPSGTPHAVEIEGNGVGEETKTVTNGKASVTADLKPGTYDFYCPVDGHRQAGMAGKLTVS